jgi:hypothetical protein
MGFIFVKKNASGPGARFGGPRPSSGLWVHGGPQAVVAEGLTGSHARGRFGDWKLTGGGEKGKGSTGGSYRGSGCVVRCRREAGDGGKCNTASVLGVGRLRARISGARWGKMLWVKWPWLRAPFIASGR